MASRRVLTRLLVSIYLVAMMSACGIKLPQFNLPTAATGTPSQPVQVVSLTQIGNSLSVRLRNPNPDVGLIRSPFELAMIDQAGAVLATQGQGGLPGAVVNTIYQLPPGGEYGLEADVPPGKTVASVELTVLGQWLKWDTVDPPVVTVTDATVLPDTGYFGPSATGRLTLDKDGPVNVVIIAFVKTSAGTVVSDVRMECMQAGQRRTFQTESIADARGPYSLDRIVAYPTAVKGAGPQFDPNCSSAPTSAPIASAPRTTSTAPLPSATPTATTQPSPERFRVPGTRYAFPGVYSAYAPASERPANVTFDYRFHDLFNLAWSDWGPNGAAGTGDETIQTTCTPSCAEGPQYKNPIFIRAANPQPPPADTGCPADVLFYTDVVITYTNTVPPTEEPNMGFETDRDLQWTTDNGMTAAHYSARKPYCSS
jgi:hypothetical protein